MSISKAALVVYFEMMLPDYTGNNEPYIYSGDVKTCHDIIDIAGAKHCGPSTTHQVLGCINNSSYWTTDNWTTKGWLNRRANCYYPSEKGKIFYEQTLKNKSGKQN